MAADREVNLVFDRDVRAMMRAIRWRPAPVDRRRDRITLLFVAVLHVGFFLALKFGTRPDRPADTAAGIEVVLLAPRPLPIDPNPVVPSGVPMADVELPQVPMVPFKAPVPAPVPEFTKPSRPAAAPSAPAAPTMNVVAIAPASATAPIAAAELRLFNPDGSLRMTPDMAAAPAPLYQRQSVEKSALMVHQSPIPYTPTAFEPAWVKPGETAGGEFLRRHLTKTKKFKTPWGSTISCGVSLFFGGCSWGAAPAPVRDRPRMPWENYVEEPPKRW